MFPDRLSLTFSALADPTRRAILARLTSGARSVTELAEPHDMSLPAISKHLQVLERSGLIERSWESQWRPCRIKAAPLKEAVDWMEQYRRHWEERLDRLDEYLKELRSRFFLRVWCFVVARWIPVSVYSVCSVGNSRFDADAHSDSRGKIKKRAGWRA